MKWIVILMFAVQLPMISQDTSFSVEVSLDTVLIGNFTKVKFSLENHDGEFTPPSFDEFDLVGGPNVSSSMSIINGDVTKSESYTYFLQPRAEGEFLIGEGTIVLENETVTTAPVIITVLPNPDEIIQDANTYKRMDGIIVPPSDKKSKFKSKRRKI